MTDAELIAQKGIRDFFRNLLTGTANTLARLNDPQHYLREGRQPPVPQVTPDASAAAQQQALDKVAKYRAEFNKRASALAADFAGGKLTPTQFRGDMLREIRFNLYTAAAAGAGGIGNLRPDDIARVDMEVKRQAEFLDAWIAQVERTPPEQRSAGQMQVRAQLYGGAAGQMVQETIDKVQFREFPNLPFYPKDWTTACGGNCACGWIWENVDRDKGDADIFWRLNVLRAIAPEEHCEHCLLRASTFKPLKIRNFVFINLPTDLSPFMTD